MGVRPGQRNIVFSIARIVTTQRGESLQDTVPHGRIASECVQDQINKGVVGVVGVREDEGTRVDSLPQTCPQLV